jgi:nucleotidyltransferase/DNA polymerase involved in DNA repair
VDVACLTIPDFPVAIARRDNPALAGVPLVIGGSPGEHAAVTACSPEAAADGVVIGMSLRRALALCPRAVFLPLQESAIAAAAAQVRDRVCAVSPVVEELAPGHLHFETRGLAALAGSSDAAWLRDLQESVVGATGLPCYLGGASSVFTAHAAALAATWQRRSPPTAVLVEAGEAAAFLGGLPIEVLPVAPHLHQRLRLLGLERLGQFAALPFSAVQAQYGREGARAWRLARGQDDSPIVPGRDELRVSESLDLPAPAGLLEPLLVATRALLGRALEHPGIRGQSVRCLDWDLHLESGERQGRRIVFREPVRDPARMLDAVRSRAAHLQLAAPVTAVEVTLSGVCSEYGHQAKLWPVGPRRWRELIDAIDQLTARTGGAQVYRIVPVQPWSRLPERQLGLVAFSS